MNRSGDGTATSSTLNRHRGLMLAGGCLAARPPSPGRWPTRRPCTACPPRSATWALSCSRWAVPTRRLTWRSRDAAGTDPTARGGTTAASAARGRPAAAAAPATQPGRPAHPVRPAALLTPPRHEPTRHARPAASQRPCPEPTTTQGGAPARGQPADRTAPTGLCGCSDPAACLRADPRPEATSILLEDRDAVSYGAGGAIGGGVGKVLARNGPGTHRGSRWPT